MTGNVNIRYFCDGVLVSYWQKFQGTPAVGQHVRSRNGLRLIETMIWNEEGHLMVCLSRDEKELAK